MDKSICVSLCVYGKQTCAYAPQCMEGFLFSKAKAGGSTKETREHQGEGAYVRHIRIYICVCVDSVPLSKQCLLVNIYKIYMI